ncbi:capsular associated protein [Seiridium cupressi]
MTRFGSPQTDQIDNPPLPPWRQPDDHAISELMDRAHKSFPRLLSKRPHNLKEAGQAYRSRRGRHPPPGFDVWFEAANRTDAIVVEDFFDRIYQDIASFWSMDQMVMRRRVHRQPQRIQVRRGYASFVADFGNFPKRWDWMELWTDVVKDITKHLPDLDMAINVMDEPRILSLREFFQSHEAKTDYTDYNYLNAELGDNSYEPQWIFDHADKYWDYVRDACPPDSPAHQLNSSMTSASESIDNLYPSSPLPSYSHRGFISNFTAAQDACQQPHLRGLHGTFVEPGGMRTLNTLEFPMFSGSKLLQNNDLLLPGAMYLTDETRYSGGQGHGGLWRDKKDGLVWRGVGSGGRSTEANWWRFHRHRFVQMVNGSAVTLLEKSSKTGTMDSGMTFRLGKNDTSASIVTSAESNDQLSASLVSFADVGFTWMTCSPKQYSLWGHLLPTCPYNDAYCTVKPQISMSKQYGNKFLPDVDGNSFSARWRGFLLSSSLPLKATVHIEWHDSRLIPWLHFVPFDNSFADIYGVLEYFRQHDEEARRIAEDGQAWARKVLRREDMVLYIWRLLLEYARVMDPQRDRLGYINDLGGTD